MTTDEVLLHVDPPVVVIHTAYGAPDWTLDAVRKVALAHPGAYRLAFCIGRHTLALGEQWTVDASRELVGALEEYGRVEVLDPPAGPPPSPASAGVTRRRWPGARRLRLVHRPDEEVDRVGDDD